jgi:hypothetical protein
LSLLKCHRHRNAFTWARSKNNRKTHLKKQNFMFNKKTTFSQSFRVKKVFLFFIEQLLTTFLTTFCQLFNNFLTTFLTTF